MDSFTYSFGVISAIITGIILNLGVILQKIVINKIPKDSQNLMKNLFKQPLWLLGFLLQYIIGTIFLFIAQFYIGPVLIPGLLAFGLIILAIGSVKIIGEKLNFIEYIGITLMIIAIFCLTFSGLSVEIANMDFTELAFLFRAYLFSGIFFISAAISGILQKSLLRYRGILLVLTSGFLFSVENLWLGILLIIIVRIFEGIILISEIIILIIAIVFVVIINIYGIITLQKAFQYGQASNLVPIQGTPIQLSPIGVYFFVFLLIPQYILSVFFLIGGIIGILVSSYLLSKRQIQQEAKELSINQ